MTRKLVTVRVVDELKPIEGADLIELAVVDGWQCVVKKGEFKVGDQGLYFEIDSFLPAEDSRFKFLEKNFSNYRNRYGARIRTIKLKGQISQGLLLPVSDFMELASRKWETFKTDYDYAEDLKVIKWEPVQPAFVQQSKKLTWFGRKIKKFQHGKLKPFLAWLEQKFPRWFASEGTKPFPSFVPKTDEERVQNLIKKIDPDTGEEYEATIKLDGSSMTVYHNRGVVGVCSRNFDLAKNPDDKFWATALKYDLPNKLKDLKGNFAIQGELMGPGIQGNREGLPTYDFFVFKIWDIDEKRFIGKTGKDDLCKKLGLKQVPSLGVMKLNTFKTIDNYLSFAEGPSLNAKTREGVVFEKVDGSKGFKVISNSYLLKHKE